MHDMPAAIAAIHESTALYTATAEIERLLDDAGWPERKGKLLDPSCGDGGIVTAALARIQTKVDDIDAVTRRIGGIEIHLPAVKEARSNIAAELQRQGWNEDAARHGATAVIIHGDFLTRDHGRATVIAANPPYLKAGRVHPAYRHVLETMPRHARADLLHAHLDKAARTLEADGIMVLVSSDRWLVNRNAADLRASIGETLGIARARRLDTTSAFHRAKTRRSGTPPRVHAVALTLTHDAAPLTNAPHRIDPVPAIEGRPLSDIAEIRLAPWLGRDGVFTIADPAALPDADLVPVVEPRDICPRTGAIGPTRRWAIVTSDKQPHESVLRHLEAAQGATPAHGRRATPWLPPERFDRHLPLDSDAILVPRLAPRLRAITLPAGHLPNGHSLVVASGVGIDRLRAMLEDERVQAMADAIALRVEDGYRSYTATLLRELVIPHDLLD